MAETNIEKALHQQLTTVKFEDPWKHIELTDEEIEVALRMARQHKGVKLQAAAYWKKISEPIIWPDWTAEELGENVINKIKVQVPDFVIDDNNREQFKLLCWYFTKDPRFENYKGGIYKFHKGIAFIGPIGSGKTTMLKAFNVNPTNCFVSCSTRQVAGEYTLKDTGGIHTINKYSTLVEVEKKQFWNQQFVGRLYDDLGVENIAKNFGNAANVMEEVLLNRYDNPELLGKTHITSNLTAQDIEETYGPRIRSRVRQMFNWIYFDPDTPDRRV